MKVLTLNTWLIPWETDYKVRREKLVEYLKKEDFDVINLQEVWFTRDVKFITESLPKYSASYAHNKVFNHSGLLTLTKNKVSRFTMNFYSFSKQEQMIKNMKNTVQELWIRRGFMIVETNVKGKKVSILNTHLVNWELPWAKKVNIETTKELQSLMIKKKRAILTGDFNLEVKEVKKITKFDYVKTKSTWDKKNPYIKKGNMTIDFVFYKGLKPVKSSLVKGLADHYGIKTEFIV